MVIVDTGLVFYVNFRVNFARIIRFNRVFPKVFLSIWTWFLGVFYTRVRVYVGRGVRAKGANVSRSGVKATTSGGAILFYYRLGSRLFLDLMGDVVKARVAYEIVRGIIRGSNTTTRVFALAVGVLLKVSTSNDDLFYGVPVMV